MKNHFVCLCITGIVCAFLFSGCKEKEVSQADLALGNWTQEKNRAYILLYINQKGEWTSSVKISEGMSKIVKAKGSAKGTWHIEKGQMIFTVMDSDIEEVWEKNRTLVYDIVELTENRIQFKDENGAMTVWTRIRMEKSGDSESISSVKMPMEPVVVNLNKNRSNDKDRYLCLKMNMIFKELMPGQKIPSLHPKVHDSIIMFFSSLVYEDVKSFDDLSARCRTLVQLLNPYMEGMINEITVENVILAADMDRVEEFVIEHTPPPPPAPGEEAKGGKEKSKDKKS